MKEFTGISDKSLPFSSRTSIAGLRPDGSCQALIEEMVLSFKLTLMMLAAACCTPTGIASKLFLEISNTSREVVL